MEGSSNQNEVIEPGRQLFQDIVGDPFSPPAGPQSSRPTCARSPRRLTPLLIRDRAC
jgi:hypothetical protein